jgi:hypothetical protein
MHTNPSKLKANLQMTPTNIIRMAYICQRKAVLDTLLAKNNKTCNCYIHLILPNYTINAASHTWQLTMLLPVDALTFSRSDVMHSAYGTAVQSCLHHQLPCHQSIHRQQSVLAVDVFSCAVAGGLQHWQPALLDFL